jgi:hypothetical protein
VHISCQRPLGLATHLVAIGFVTPQLPNGFGVSFRLIIILIRVVIIESCFLSGSNLLFHSRVSWQIHQTHLSLLLPRLLLLFYFTFIFLFPSKGSHSAGPHRDNN